MGTAVENTFVQFHSLLFEVAKKMGTVKATYHPMKKVSRPPAIVHSRRGRLQPAPARTLYFAAKQ
jgi:hypothetical protein